jgi:flagellar protein FliS
MNYLQARFQEASASYTNVDISSRVEAASPHQLVKILYEELVRSLGLMAAALKGGNASSLGASQARALSVLSWLQSTLDMDRGGDVAAILATLYADCRRRTIRAVRERDPAAILEVRGTVAEIAEAWAMIGAPATPPSTDPAYASSL